ncbi:hypothetical protein GCM10011386_00210 [Parapedobacter defluvii]|uniref:PKD domain-containing protein n=2 Tax=Parapedobacter defluvii TaxID=2045106 RepID=A0ABQ1KWK8_9SPHI|nr:hypothetical protein GCM10011386_00210 [Parapedobacter defluvii]
MDYSEYMRVVAVADFTTTVQAPNNLTVKITNNSKNAKTIQWDFGDGSPASSETEPTHTYSEPGVYTIALNIQSATGFESTKSLDVTVTPVDVIPVVNFAYEQEGSDPLKIKFTNQSQDGITFLWNFGDESATSTDESPTHVFPVTGKYAVTLTATSTTGNDNARIIHIRVPKLTEPEKLDIVNPSFELDPKDSYVITGWDPVVNNYPGSPGWGGFFIAEIPKTGTRCLLFWTPSVDSGNGHTHELAYQGSVTQTIGGLEDGKYSFRAWVYSKDMEGMSLLANGGGEDIIKEVGTNDGYTQLSLDFEVVGGVAKIGFLMNRPEDIGDNWSPVFQVDDAELWILPQ